MPSELDQVLKEAQKEHGEHIGGKGFTLKHYPRVSTGLFPFDLAVGGGFPRGRMSVVYGPESSGKSTVCYRAMATAQKEGQDAVLIDIENSFDADWASYCGVDLDKVVILNPPTAEVAVDLVDAVLRADTVGIVVLDSIGSMVTANEIESDAGKMIVGGSAMVVSKLTRKINNAMGEEHKRQHAPAMVCINQIRHKIGVMYGDPEDMPGGNLLKFTSALTVRLYGKDQMVHAVSKDLPALKTIKGVLKKWKVPVLSKAFEFDMCLIPHDGMERTDSKSWNTVLNYLKTHGVISKHGNGWQCAGEEFKTQAAIQERYMSEPHYAGQLQQLVVEAELGSQSVLAPQV